ncbi:Ig-like domain-containing protein, partial [Leucobacter chromiiresistens]
MTFLLLLASLVTYGQVAGATQADAATYKHGAEIGTAVWPDDVNLAEGSAVWSIAAGISGSPNMGVIGAFGGTPTEPIRVSGALANLGVSSDAEHPGLYINEALNLGAFTPITPEVKEHYESAGAVTPAGTTFTNSGHVRWVPGSGPNKGKAFAIELPIPNNLNTSWVSNTCSIEVNQLTNELVILIGPCDPGYPGYQNNILYFSPGPDGDPLTLEDNAVEYLETKSTPNLNGVSDMTLDAAGNVYGVEDGLNPTIWRWNRDTGQHVLLGKTKYSSSNGTASPANVGLAFYDGRIINPAVPRNLLPLQVNPLTKEASALPNGSWQEHVKGGGTGWTGTLDSAGSGPLAGGVGFGGTVTDESGNPVSGSQVAIYRDNGDGTATLAGTTVATDTNGSFAGLLDSSSGTFYLRLVQPQLVTGSERKNGEVVDTKTYFTVGADVTGNQFTVLNDRNNGSNPPAGTPGETTIDVTESGLNDLVKYDLVDARSVAAIDFTVAFAGSTADQSPNSLLTTDARTGNGPQHVTLPGDDAADLRLGATNGNYAVGKTDGSHESDDGVYLNLSGDTPLAANQLFAAGASYPLLAKSEGSQADNAKVSAWMSAAGAANANPRGAFGPVIKSSGANAEFEVPFPSTAGQATLRVNSSLTEVEKPDNSSNEYAGAADSQTQPWTTAGEVEDYDVKVVDSVVRLSVDSTLSGDYSYEMSGVSATAPSANNAKITVAEAGLTAEEGVHEGSMGKPVVLTPSVPEGAELESAEVIDSVTGDSIGAAEVAADGTVTIPGSLMTLGADIRLVLSYSEPPSASASTLEVGPPDTVLANGEATIPATVTVVGAQSGSPLSGQDVKITSSDDNVVVSDVTDNGDGTYTATLTSSVAGTYPTIHATVAIDGVDTEVSGSPGTASFTAGTPSSENSTWSVGPTGPLTVGTGSDSTYTAVAEIADAFGNPVGAGVDVTFVVPAGVNDASEETQTVVTTDENGRAALELQSTRAGTYAFAARLGDEQIGDTEERSWNVAGMSSTDSAFEVSSGTRIADGQDAHVATAKLVDAYGNPVSGEEITFTLPGNVEYAGARGTLVSGTSGAIVVATGADGIAEVELVSAKAGTYEVSASSASGALGTPQSITYAAGTVDAQESTWTITPESPVQVNETYTATIVAKDALGNPVSGAEVELVLPADVTTVNGAAASGVTDDEGALSIPVTSTVKGAYTVQATVAGQPVGGTAEASSKEIAFTAAESDATKSTLSATEGIVTADGEAEHTVTATIKDRYGNPVEAGTEVVFAFPSELTVESGASPVTTTTNAFGQAILKVATTVAGSYEVSAEVEVEGALTAISNSPVSVAFGNSDADAQRSSWKVSPDGEQTVGEAFVAEALIVDANGNPVAGETVTFAIPAGVNGSAAPSSITAVTNDDGLASVELSSTIAGTYEVVASVAGSQIGEARELVFVAAQADMTTSQIAASKSSINGDSVDASEISVELRDGYGNVISDGDYSVLISTDRGQLSDVVRAADGRFTATLTGDESDAGTATISYTVNGEPGGSTVTVEIVDIAAPEAPTAVAVGDSVEGAAEPGTTVEIRDAETGEVVCSVVADENGQFSCGPVGDGNYDVVAVDTAGNESAPSPVTVDTTAPEAPSVSVDGDTVTGETEPGAKVEVRDPGTGEVVCETVADENGVFSCGPVDDGSFEVV